MATYGFTVNGGRARSSHPNPASLCSMSSATDTAGQVTQNGDLPYAVPFTPERLKEALARGGA